MSVLGTPPEAEVEEIANAELKQYIKSKGKVNKINLESLYPDVSPLAIDLLQKLLRLDP